VILGKLAPSKRIGKGTRHLLRSLYGGTFKHYDNDLDFP
jgi:hypothetical protein